jgi:hypothetical protein
MTMISLFRGILQLVTYGTFAAALGYFSFWPRYEYASAELATIKVSVSHATRHVKPCVLLTPQQIAELPPNMRRTESCERKRLPLTMEVEVDGDIMLRVDAEPSGLWGDGPASVYERFEVAPGVHVLTTRLRDTDRAGGWDYVRSDEVFFQPGRYFSVTFRAENEGISYR